jgi:hypothetical protein
MRREIVQDQHVAAPDRWAQHLLDVGVEGVGIDRPFDRHRRFRALKRDGADDRSLWPVIARHTFCGALPPRGAPIQASHRRVNTCLVDEAQPQLIYLTDAPPEPRSLVVVAFGCGKALFLCGRASCASARQMVETWTLTPSCSSRWSATRLKRCHFGRALCALKAAAASASGSHVYRRHDRAAQVRWWCETA